MVLHEGDMWTVFGRADLFLITANSYVTAAGRLVMGKGMAKQAAERFPDFPYRVGSAIDLLGKHLGVYGLLVSLNWEKGEKLGLFQVKRHYDEDADVDIIQTSADALADWCECHPGAEVHLNFPGIGAGRLHPKVVIPLITWLPDQVHVWRRG